MKSESTYTNLKLELALLGQFIPMKGKGILRENR